jgi:hypothetical protein
MAGLLASLGWLSGVARAARAEEESSGVDPPPPVANIEGRGRGGGMRTVSVSASGPSFDRLYGRSPETGNVEATSARTGSSSKILRALAKAAEEGGGI